MYGNAMTEVPSTVEDLYPNLSAEQLGEADANLERFLAVMLRIAARLQAEGYDLSTADLTITEESLKIHPERSNLIQLIKTNEQP